MGRRKNYYEHPREDAIIMTKEFTHGDETADAGMKWRLFYDRDLDDAFPGAELKPLRVMEDARQTGKYQPLGPLRRRRTWWAGAFTW